MNKQKEKKRSRNIINWYGDICIYYIGTLLELWKNKKIDINLSQTLEIGQTVMCCINFGNQSPKINLTWCLQAEEPNFVAFSSVRSESKIITFNLLLLSFQWNLCLIHLFGCNDKIAIIAGIHKSICAKLPEELLLPICCFLFLRFHWQDCHNCQKLELQCKYVQFCLFELWSSLISLIELI